MSLSSYQELRQAIADWAQREDVGVRSKDFIALVEADVNRRLRVRDMLTRDTFTATSSEQYIGLPTDYLEMNRLTVTSTDPDRELRYLTPQMMSLQRWQHPTAGEPIYYSIVADQIEFIPTPSQDYTVERLYFAKITPLDTTNTSNWLLADWPDAYLHGCLHHAFVFVFDEQRAAYHKERYEEILEEIKLADRNARAGQRPVMRAKSIGEKGYSYR